VGGKGALLATEKGGEEGWFIKKKKERKKTPIEERFSLSGKLPHFTHLPLRVSELSFG